MILCDSLSNKMNNLHKAPKKVAWSQNDIGRIKEG